MIKHHLGGALLAAALLTQSSNMVSGGIPEITTSAEKPVIEKVADRNPLSFLNGTLCLDVQARTRWEIRDNTIDFNDAINDLNDDNWFLFRFRLGALWKPVSWFSVYVQGQDSEEWNSDRPNIPGASGSEGDNEFDLRQAWVQFGDPEHSLLTLKVGRQTLTYGDERLIGPLDWTNFARTFDAAKLSLKQPTWQLDAFVSSVVVIREGTFDGSDLFNINENHRDQVFSGLYFTAPKLSFGTLDLYALWLSQARGTVSNLESGDPLALPTTGPLSRSTSFGTFGGRLHGDPKKLHGFEFDVEGAYQNGTVRGMALNAFAAHAGGGYNFAGPLKPRLWLEYNYATGDQNPNDGNSETFQNLFPTNHKFYGSMDLFAWQNMHNVSFGLRVTPIPSVTAEVLIRAFWLASTDDVWYRANGLTPVRPLTPAAQSASSEAGQEIDLVVNWTVNKHLAFQGGFSHFLAGNYLADTGTADNANFGYLMATVNF